MSSDIAASITDWLSAQPGFDAFELAGLTVRRNGKRSFIEILLDRKTGLITLDECGRWNRVLSNHLEQTDLFSGPFVVEISSPGVDRPLTRPRDFERAMGRMLKVRYQAPSDSVREVTGRLERSDDAGIDLQSEEQKLNLPYVWILQARQEITFSKEMN